MIIRVRVHGLFQEPRDFAIGYPIEDAAHSLLELIHLEHGGERIVQDLTCAAEKAHPVWLVVARIPDPKRGKEATRWSLRHWPGSGLSGGHSVPARSARMSDEHKMQREYAWRCAEDHPRATGVKERSVARGTISDVAMFVGDVAVATSEIQLADEHETKIFRRDSAVANRGIDPMWFGNTDSRPNWANRVAWLGTNRLQHLRPGGWTVATGHRGITWERCTESAPRPCPVSPRPCGRVHPMWEPRGGAVDDVIARVLDRDLRRYDVGNRIVLATPADIEAWADHFGADPTTAAAKVAAAEHRRDLAGKQVLHRARRRDEGPADEDVVAAVARASRPLCIECGEPLLLIRPGRDRCARHPGDRVLLDPNCVICSQPRDRGWNRCSSCRQDEVA